MESPRYGLGDFLLFNKVKTSTVNHPELPDYVFSSLRINFFGQGFFHPVKQIDLSYPSDADYYMKPANEQVQQLVNLVRFHFYQLPL
jgi:hypothetical protein